nr:MAG TPA: hypothetical protein [Caudoviricetes sp.]
MYGIYPNKNRIRLFLSYYYLRTRTLRNDR